MPNTSTPLEVGSLRHPITWQQTTAPTPDSVGDYAESWMTMQLLFGNVRPLAGRELFNARQLKETISHEIVVRNPIPSGLESPIRPDDRFLFGSSSRVFSVDFVFRVDERNAMLLIHASEQPPAASE